MSAWTPRSTGTAQRTGQPEQQPRDPAEEALLAGLAGLLGLVFAPLVLAWWLGPRWAERPSAWRPASRLTRGAAALSVPAGYAALWAAHDALVDLVWPLSWPATALAALAWWAALTPTALVVARLRARAQGDALSAGRADPMRADAVRRAVWEALLARLARAAGADTFARPPRVTHATAVPTCDLGTVAVHDARNAVARGWTRTRAGSPDRPRARVPPWCHEERLPRRPRPG